MLVPFFGFPFTHKTIKKAAKNISSCQGKEMGTVWEIEIERESEWGNWSIITKCVSFFLGFRFCGIFSIFCWVRFNIELFLLYFFSGGSFSACEAWIVIACAFFFVLFLCVCMWGSGWFFFCGNLSCFFSFFCFSFLCSKN